MAQTHIPIQDLTPQITMNVVITGYRGWQIRLQVALLLIQLAARLAGLGIKIDDSEEGED